MIIKPVYDEDDDDVGTYFFSAQCIKINFHKKIGHNINVLRHTACLVVNSITFDKFGFFFNCTPVDRTLKRYDGTDIKTYL